MESHERFEKESLWPELVIHETWPAVALSHPHPEQSSSDGSKFGVELRAISGKGLNGAAPVDEAEKIDTD